MSNLTSDRDTEFVDELRRDSVPVAAGTQLFNGGAVGLNAGGYAVPAGAGVAHFRGIADETVDNSDGADGDQDVEIITPDGAFFDASGLTEADLGEPVYFADDHTVTLTAGTNTYAGRIREVTSATECLVDLRGGYVEPAVGTQASATTAAATSAA